MKANDKVVCVDDSPCRHSGLKLLQKGQIYCIRDLLGIAQGFSGPCIRVVGVYLPLVSYGRALGQECAWAGSRFRLVSEVGHPPIAVEQPQEVEA